MPAVPAGAKTPTDRQAAKTDGPQSVTVRGIKVTVDPATLDDWTFVEDLAVAQGGDEDSMFAAIRVLRTLAGTSYMELRNKAIEEAGGKLTVEKGASALLPLVQEILEGVGSPNS